MKNYKRTATRWLVLISAVSSSPTLLTAQGLSPDPGRESPQTQVIANLSPPSFGQYFNRWLSPQLSTALPARASEGGVPAMALGVDWAIWSGIYRLSNVADAKESEPESILEDLPPWVSSLKEMSARNFDLAGNTHVYLGLGQEKDFGLLLKFVNSR